MRGDPALRQRWGRYNLISDALHKNLPRQVDHDLHARVARALEEEPVLLAPQRRIRPMRPWAKQAAGIAVAASVTAIAILGFQTLHSPEVTPSAATTVTAAAAPGAANAVEDTELDPYLVNHNEHAVSAGMHGMLPYVRLDSHGESE
jgi:sigma-E factor negative regulatory protein RseA